ncbi:MAG TPA: methylated-DNA--[protein]-cysteine S-methyltransferase [Candidatus Elarobacter sp.]|jgi:O-6-methylguanine DNA methyltransferase
MSETNMREFREAAGSAISPGFTAKVFAGCGLDRYVTAVSPLGDVNVAWNACGVTAVRRAGDDEAFEVWYAERFGRRVVRAVEDDPTSTAARAKLRGEQVDVPTDLSECSEFEQRVLRKAAEISSGNARPYAWVARELGAPDAARAVGNALGRNPVPLLIPCHRVVRTDYSAGGYVFGTEAKRALLEGEGMDLGAVEAITRRGIRYIGCDDGTFCLPTCGDVVSHVGQDGYVALHSLEEAHRHGLQPCASCRPVAA